MRGKTTKCGKTIVEIKHNTIMDKCVDDNINLSNSYFDHVYCNSSELKQSSSVKHVLTENNHTQRPGDALILEENKRLNAMLVLHLDLIQEQNDQLITNNKQLVTLNEEVSMLRSRITQLEGRIQELQKKVQLQIKRAAVGDSELSTLRLPPLAKIQTKSAAINNVKPALRNSITPPALSKEYDNNNQQEELSSKASIQCDHIIELQQHEAVANLQPDDNMNFEFTEQDNEDEILSNSTDDSTSFVGSDYLKSKSERKSSREENSPKQKHKKCAFKDPRTPNRGKEMSLVMWHALDTQREERGNCESLDSTEFASSGETSSNPLFCREPGKSDKCKGISTVHLHTLQPKLRRCTYFYSPQMYYTREWEGKNLTYEYEFVKEEFNHLNMDAPNLEIPNWTEHELPSTVAAVNATNTIAVEDVGDEIYLKRHTKFETDEKRRKKWDVQQIREQRRIEKLKRRHCKDELLTVTEQSPLFQSFYPQASKVQMICFINELPVQAFGEAIPKISLSSEFRLPWINSTGPADEPMLECNANCVLLSEAPAFSNSGNSGFYGQQRINSSYVYLKKRRRQPLCSSSSGRQRNLHPAKPSLSNFVTTEIQRNVEMKPGSSTGDNLGD